jgi:hypothetical protein
MIVSHYPHSANFVRPIPIQSTAAPRHKGQLQGAKKGEQGREKKVNRGEKKVNRGAKKGQQGREKKVNRGAKKRSTGAWKKGEEGV